MTSLFDLNGKIALVTGGSRGMGRAIALGLADHGADVVIVSRKLENCETVAREVEQRGRHALALSGHMGRWDEIEAVVDSAYAHFGRLDILVNNAGMSPATASSLETPEKLVDAVLALNFKGPMRMSALVGTRMAAGDGGCIINISSAGSIRPTPEIVPYAGAKAALNAMTVAHAQEYAPKVRVNAVLPGSFRTDVAKHWPADKEATTPAVLRRFGEPDEIVTTILYLCSDHSGFTTGSMIRVDGGRP
ncbi:short-chain dehydrogenase [Sphingobium lactosutens]|uniref:SDR family NAD(P)-dependent oxidoreductase n=1 Tax=Sphingobium lactosutens TaxID=522773 RepID=UPI0015C054E3|nr:glucose 1-dehydrogenase [Sphingobium lactosutens]NWK98258.1 short-chain dehydrogenase [Sphingobium lactosutens]